jgi:hypothetical protein
MALRRLAPVALVALALVVPARAVATGPIDVYASQQGVGSTLAHPPCPQADPCDLTNAISAANGNSGGGTVHVLGSLHYTANSLSLGASGNPVHLLGTGSGTGDTFIDVSQPTALTLSYGSTVDDVRIRAQDVAVDLAYGSILSNSVVLTTASGSTGVAVAALPGAGSNATATLANDVVSPQSGSTTAVQVASGTSSQSLAITDSTMNGYSGVIDIQPPPADIRRSTINSTGGTGVEIAGGQNAYVSSSVIHMSGATVGPVAAYVHGPSTIHLVEDTLDGADSSGPNEAGVLAGEGFMIFGSHALVTDSIVRNFGTDLHAQSGSGANQGGEITVSTSDFSTHAADSGSNNGVFTNLGGNVDQPPGLANRAGGDYRLRFDSPLIDAGGVAALDSHESTTDRSGVTPRIQDGNNSGTAERDIGAFEYVFARPVASFTAAPQPAPTDQPVSFDAGGSTYSIGPVADYAWDLDGNGSFETDTGADPSASHVYPSAGTVNVGLRVTGFDGGPAQTTKSIAVQQASVVPGQAGLGGNGPNGGGVSGVQSFSLLGRTLLVRPPRTVKVRAACLAAAALPCSMRIVIQSAGRVKPRATAMRRTKPQGTVLTLGRGSATIAPGKTGSVKVKLSTAAMKLLRAHKLERVNVIASPTGAGLAAQWKSRTYKLKLAHVGKKKRR